MAVISFTSSLATNPGLEDVLDPSGTITVFTSTVFEITNAAAGTWNGFKFRFTGTSFGYSGTTPTGGTITGVTVLDASDNVVATATETGVSTFGDPALANTWSALQSDGALAALNLLFSSTDTTTGSGGVDHLTTFGTGADFDTLSGGAGDDVLWAPQSGIHTLVGGTGSDVFRIDAGLTKVAGSASDGSGGAGETNVIEVGASGQDSGIQFIELNGVAAITNIGGLRFAAPVDDISTAVTLSAGQLGAGLLSPTLAVEGSTANASDSITILLDGSAADVDLSGWTFSNWTRTNQTVSISLFTNPTDHHIVGSRVADFITSDTGNDTIDGGTGDDFIDGGGGTNTISGGSGDDSLFGGAGADILLGGDGSDSIFGNGGNDFLAAGVGFDILVGGPGDDTYVAVVPLVIVVEDDDPGGGNDLLYVGIGGYTLPANVETLWLTNGAMTGFGNDAPGNTLVGNAVMDSAITGGASGDLLVGAHTSSKTTMAGGGWDDVYVTFNSADVIQEIGAGGNDTVYAAVDFVQPANVETLWLVGGATHGTGNNAGGTLIANNNLSSTITGGAAADVLIGAHDVTSTLAGGGGDDTYVVFLSGDTVQEQPGGGNDTLYTTADFVLPANVETMWLIGGATQATSNSSGGTLVANNNLDGALTGSSGRDLLVGGHASTTTMTGGGENDTFVTFNATDAIVESAPGGNDTLVTFATRTIPTNVETMFLAEGAGAINGTGGSGADAIYGNAFANVLDGRGNIDVLVGGAGNDTFVFQRGEASGDTVTDLAGLGAGGGDTLQFVGYGTAAQGANLTQLDAIHWQINSADGTVHETITLQNGAAVQAGDFLFV